MSDDPRWGEDPRDHDDDSRDENRDRADEWRQPGYRRDFGDGDDRHSADQVHTPQDRDERDADRDGDGLELGRGPSSNRDESVLLYLVTVPWTDEFRTFVQSQSAFLRSVPAWTLRLVFPRPLDRAYDSYQKVIHEELDGPLQQATIDELKWHFEHRQKAIGSADSTQTQALLNRAEVFNTPRFTLLYRRWLRHGNTAFETLSSPVLGDALANGTGLVECLVLPHAYRHLSPLASLVRSTPKGVEKGEQGGEQVPPRPQPVPSPAPPASLTIAEQLERDW
jgi:hypothetical protein